MRTFTAENMALRERAAASERSRGRTNETARSGVRVGAENTRNEREEGTRKGSRERADEVVRARRMKNIMDTCMRNLYNITSISCLYLSIYIDY